MGTSRGDMKNKNTKNRMEVNTILYIQLIFFFNTSG